MGRYGPEAAEASPKGHVLFTASSHADLGCSGVTEGAPAPVTSPLPPIRIMNRNSFLQGIALVVGLASVAQAQVVVNTNISTSTTWTANNVYQLQGDIYVLPGASLTIQAGTVIASTNNSTLAICRGAQILANCRWSALAAAVAGRFGIGRLREALLWPRGLIQATAGQVVDAAVPIPLDRVGGGTVRAVRRSESSRRRRGRLPSRSRLTGRHWLHDRCGLAGLNVGGWCQFQTRGLA